MPLITRLFIKSAFLYLLAALLVGLLRVATPFFPLPAVIQALNPVYFHLFMVGWVTELIMGVAYWMFPRFTREAPRGSAQLAWATYVLLNLGLILRVIAEPLVTLQPSRFWGTLLAISALAQWLAGLAFVINTWPRVKER